MRSASCCGQALPPNSLATSGTEDFPLDWLISCVLWSSSDSAFTLLCRSSTCSLCSRCRASVASAWAFREGSSRDSVPASSCKSLGCTSSPVREPSCWSSRDRDSTRSCRASARSRCSMCRDSAVSPNAFSAGCSSDSVLRRSCESLVRACSSCGKRELSSSSSRDSFSTLCCIASARSQCSACLVLTVSARVFSTGCSSDSAPSTL
mmetsp:Transcript_54376/g.117698  ORF Transcript_54376/g.117698 Transcript_54376/m.117698 type:complete len:207 (+) Transcript_54376:285-905(+)